MAADLSISKSDTIDPVNAGNQLTYSIIVSNAGPIDARDVVVTDTLPAGVIPVITSGCAEDPLAVPICTLGTIPASTQATYVIVVHIDAATSGLITNQATVTSSTPEALPGDEDASVETTVLNQANLCITKTGSVDPVVAGSELTYTITVNNAGLSDAQDVVVTDTLSPEVTFISTSGCSEDPGGVPICTVGTIGSGHSDEYTIAVAVDPTAAGLITNQATVTSSTSEANPGDESASDTTESVIPANVIFIDGFESGNAMLWSSEVP